MLLETANRVKGFLNLLRPARYLGAGWRRFKTCLTP